jgi:hypothetical protein
MLVDAPAAIDYREKKEVETDRMVRSVGLAAGLYVSKKMKTYFCEESNLIHKTRGQSLH